MATRVCIIHGRRHTRSTLWPPHGTLQPGGSQHETQVVAVGLWVVVVIIIVVIN